MTDVDDDELFKAQFVDKSQPEADGASTYIDPSDGTVYEWEPTKRAWFPQLSDEFLANYHLNYGAESSDSSKPVPMKVETGVSTADHSTVAGPQKQPTKGEKRKANAAEWFSLNESKNNHIYVSGMPCDVTESEFIELCSKCGIILEDDNEEKKIKLYQDSEGNMKGDGLCTYLKVESVALALEILDGSMMRGEKLHIEKALFKLKGDYNPKLKPKRKPNNKKKKKIKNPQEKMLDWRPERSSTSHRRNERVIILRGMFDPKEFEEDASAILEIRDDIRSECEKIGPVKKVTVFDRHPDGVCSVAFREYDDADIAVARLDQRFFGQVRINAEVWDGSTNYSIEETDREREVRLANWEKYVDEEADAVSEPTGKSETESKTVSDESKTVSDESKTVSDESKTVSDENKTVSDESETVSDDIR